jgi:hypothetical protein
MRIDDYDKNLKREKRKRRQEERDKKNDPILGKSKYVQIIGGGSTLALSNQNKA